MCVASLSSLCERPSVHEVAPHTHACVVVLQVGVVGVELQSALVAQPPQVLLAALTHTGVVPLQQEEPQTVPVQPTQVEPEQVSLVLVQQVVLAPLPQVLVLAQ